MKSILFEARKTTYYNSNKLINNGKELFYKK